MQSIGLALLQDETGDSGYGGIIGFFVVLVAIIAGIMIHASYKRRFSETMAQLGLKPIGDRLPSSFPSPSGVWKPDVRIKECFTGLYNGVETAVFRVQVGRGEGAVMRYSVAAKRAPWTPQSVSIEYQAIVIDSTSSPGWIVSSVDGMFPKSVIVQALLRILTAAEPPSANRERDPMAGYPSNL